MRCGSMPECAKISEISRDLSFCLQKKKIKVIITGLHALAHILGTASIAVVRLMFIVHDWFICTSNFSCCMNDISSRMSINSSPEIGTYNPTGSKRVKAN